MFEIIINKGLAAWLLVPLGVLGAWRWSMWSIKRLLGAFYRPILNGYRCSATVLTAVYDEDPMLFRRALDSWQKSGATRIVAVIQGDDRGCATVAADFPAVEVVYLLLPGKRDALVAGLERCKSDITILTDSDAIWRSDVLEKLMMPFVDPTIGGVGTRQNMRPTGDRPTEWEELADIFLDVRYSDEVPATSYWGRAISCLSGRTSAYRTTFLQEVKGELLTETFNGRRCRSGDDKRLTTLLLQRGYRTWSQLNAHVYSTFQPTFVGFVRQRVRWSRNTYRSDLRAMVEGWVWWRCPWLALIMADKAIAPIAQVFGLVFFSIAALRGWWDVVVVQIAWWHVSRGIKIIPHLRRRPKNGVLLSLFVGATILNSFIRLYGLSTLNKHDWLTRGPADKIKERGVADQLSKPVLAE